MSIQNGAIRPHDHNGRLIHKRVEVVITQEPSDEITDAVATEFRRLLNENKLRDEVEAVWIACQIVAKQSGRNAGDVARYVVTRLNPHEARN